jgi:hypothetical protein
MIRETTLAALLAISLGLAACEKQGPAERAGEKVDDAVSTIKNGGEEPASQKLENAAEETKEAAQQAVEDAKD